jgi:hypothetical protein
VKGRRGKKKEKEAANRRKTKINCFGYRRPAQDGAQRHTFTIGGIFFIYYYYNIIALCYEDYILYSVIKVPFFGLK